jgi:outer membrane protein OmpA-like peptidoglycan-associated protein/tetratricopeptide (TPR) repeat protein
MNKIIVSLCISFSIVFTSCYSQVQTLKNVDKKAANYFNEARVALMQGQSAKSIEYLKMAVEVAPNFIDATSTLGQFYYTYNHDNVKAEELLKKAIELDPNYDFNNYITLAQIKLSEQKYEEAVEFANKIIDSKEEGATDRLKKEATRLKNNCDFAKEAIAHPVPFTPINMGAGVNSTQDEYFAALTADDQYLYMTRSNKGMNGEDIWYSIQKDKVWSKALPVGANINTPDNNEGAHTISPNGKYLIFTGCNLADGLGSCDLYISKRNGDDWDPARNLGPAINSRGWESQASISGDGKDLYFTRRVGNHTDIFVSYLDEKTGFSQAVSIGSPINTENIEERPFIHPDNQTLYFSSDGHPGMGSMDMYVSKRNPDGTWSTPKNLGYPINTSDNESGLFVGSGGNIAYFSSTRKGGIGGEDIYSFELPKESRPDEVTYVKGIITDADTKMMLQANIQLYDVATGQKITSMTSDAKNGSFLVTLPIGKDYMCNVSKDGYLFYSENFSLINYTDKEPFLLDIQLNKIKEGVSIVLKNIFFETAKATLKDESKTELNKLVELLTKNPTIKIEIGGHTDNVGVDAENLKLSDARAVAVKNYLTANGISADRLSTKGYGETQPIADNNTEVGRAKNRRTEFKVISK